MAHRAWSEKELIRRANRRLAVLQHAEEVSGNVAATCRYYGISRNVFYRWKRRYEDEGLGGLKDRSSAPFSGRDGQVGPLCAADRGDGVGDDACGLEMDRGVLDILCSSCVELICGSRLAAPGRTGRAAVSTPKSPSAGGDVSPKPRGWSAGERQ